MFHAREIVEPERFTFHSSRMRMKKVTKEELETMDRDSGRCALELVDARVDVLGYACLVSFGLHCLQLGLQVVLAYALRLPVPLWYLILFIPLVHLLSALPVSFGGIGVRESSYVMFLALIGIGRHQALAFGFLWSALVLGGGMVGGVVLVLSPEVQRSLARIRKTSDG